MSHASRIWLAALVALAGACSSAPPTLGKHCHADADCGEGKWCESSGACAAGCSTSDECPGEVCDPASHACVACAGDGDCEAGKVCENHACVAGCNASHGCPAGLFCDSTTSTCVGCVDDTDCVAGQICKRGACADGCSASHGCAPGLVCDTSTSSCVACVADADCATGKVCKADQCVDGCSADHGCAPGLVCDVARGACAECAADADCAAGKLCKADQCVDGCTADHACALGEVCDVASATCVGCLADDDCANGWCDATSHTCQAGCTAARGCDAPEQCDTSTHACVDCLGDDDCALGSVCASNACVAGCDANHGCASPDVCDVALGRCVACASDDDCAAGSICVNDVCIAGCDAGHACASPLVCDVGTSSCVACVGDANCALGAVCLADECVPGCDVGHGCESPLVCDTAKSSCVECAGDSDCALGAICENDRCVAGCDAGHGCESPLVCDVAKSACVDCTSDATCSNGQHCDTSIDSCVECATDEQCPAGKLCANDACVAGCSATHACPGGEGCVLGSCAPLPTITNFAPASGVPGSVVTIDGTHFGTTEGSSTVVLAGVTLGASDVTSWSDTHLVVTVPASAAPATGPIQVTTDAGVATSARPFSIVEPTCMATALTLNGSASATANDSPAFALGNRFTVEAWIDPSSTGGSVAFKNAEFSLALQSGKLVARVYTATGWTSWFGSGNVPTGRWSHVAMVYDGWEVRTYVNGAMSGSGHVSGFVQHPGTQLTVGQGEAAFTGLVDELRISTAVRYTGSAFDLPAGPFAPDAATAALWHFDDDSTTSAADASGGSNTLSLSSATFAQQGPPLACTATISGFTPDAGGPGTKVTVVGTAFGPSGSATFAGAAGTVDSWSAGQVVVEAPASASTGRVGVGSAKSGSDFAFQPCDPEALRLPYSSAGGASAYAQANDSPSLPSGLAVTLEAWVYPTFATTSTQDIVFKNVQFELSLVNGSLAAQLYTSAGWSGWFTGGQVATNGWHHVAATYDGGTVRLFVDGALTKSQSFSGVVPHSTTALVVGGNNQFYGQIDEVRLSTSVRYRVAFTPPAGPFAVDGATAALWHFDDAPGATSFSDASPNALTLVPSQAVVTSMSALACGPAIDDVTPRDPPAGGGIVTLSGSGFGKQQGQGTVSQDGQPLTVVSWSDTAVKVVIPADGSGVVLLTTDGGQQTSTGVSVTPLTCAGRAAQLPVTSPGSPTGYLQAPGTTSLQPVHQLTMEAWIEPTVSVPGEQDVLYKNAEFELAIVANRLQARIYTATGWSGWAGSGAVALDHWSHVAAVYDGWKLATFIDGQPAGSEPLSGSFPDNHTTPLQVGAGGGQFYGRIDELRISSLARYDDAFDPPAGPFATDDHTLALYHFDDADGSRTAVDASGNSNDLVATNDVTFVTDAPALACGPVVSQVSPPVGGAGSTVTLVGRGFGDVQGSSTVTFGSSAVGASDVVSWSDRQIKVRAPAEPAGLVAVTVGGVSGEDGFDFVDAPCGLWGLELPATSTGTSGSSSGGAARDSTSFAGGHALTVEAFVYPTVAATSNETIVFKNAQYELGYVAGNLQARLYNGSGWGSWVSSSTSTKPKLNAWNHVAMTYDGAALRVFVDGALAGEGAFGGEVNHPATALDVGQGDGQFYGAIEEVRVSNRVRYLETFTPPSGPFAKDAATAALWHFDDGLDATSVGDASGNGNTLTLQADAQLWPFGALGCGPAMSGVPASPAQGGGDVTLVGRGFGSGAGTITQDGRTLTVVSWSDTQIVVAVPGGSTGPLEGETADGEAFSTGADVSALTCEGDALQLPPSSASNGTGTLAAPDSASLVGGLALTLEAWVEPTASVAGTQTILYKNAQYELALVANRLEVRFYTSTGWSSWMGSAPVPENRWSHLAAVYDGQAVRTYLNGSLASTDALGGVVGHPATGLVVGGGDGQFYGNLDELLVSGEVRYAGAEFTPAVRHAVQPADAALWHFDDGPDWTSASDATGHGNTLVPTGDLSLVPRIQTPVCPPVVEDVEPRAGAIGSAVTVSGANFGSSPSTSEVDFSAADSSTVAATVSTWSDKSLALTVPADAATGLGVTVDGVTTPSPVPFVVTCAGYAAELPATTIGGGTGGWQATDSPSMWAGTNLTVEALVYPTSSAGTQTIAYRNARFELAIVSGRLQARVYGSVGWSTWSGSAVVPTNQWSHVAMTFDGTSLVTWLEGVAQPALSFAHPLCGGGSSCSGIALDVGYGDGQFYGQIDELRLSNVARASVMGPGSPPLGVDSDTGALWHFDDATGRTGVDDATGHGNTLVPTGAVQRWPSSAPIACP